MAITSRYRRILSLVMLVLLAVSFWGSMATSAYADTAVTKNASSKEAVFTIKSGSGLGYVLGTKTTTCWITNCTKNSVQIQISQTYKDNVKMAFTLGAYEKRIITLKGSDRTFYITAWRYANSGNVAVSLNAGSVK